MWAAAENHAAAVKVLIEGGADVNMRSATLNFPPFKWGVVGMVSTVLPKGVVDAADVRGARERDATRSRADGAAAPT